MATLLLRRLLPPIADVQLAQQPLSAADAALLGQAMRQRRMCSYLCCPNLAAPGASRAASKRCGACRQARYDCRECQRADWKAWHRHACGSDG